MAIPEPVVIGPCTLYCGDCMELLPTLEVGSVDAVVTDPPYGIGKADWDDNFNLDWFDHAAPLTETIGITPGTWNLMDMPNERAGLRYRWTFSAHLINGMTRGGFGWGNWMPFVVYERPAPLDSSKPNAQEWCKRFREWLDEQSIKTKDINAVLGTRSMAGRFREKTWSVIPSSGQWAKIRDAFNPPKWLDPPASRREGPIGDCKHFSVGNEIKPDHPSPKPVNVVLWFLEVVGGQTILDPFMGSGTTGVACIRTGRRFIGIEKEPKYFDIACRRIRDELARTALIDHAMEPPRQLELITEAV